LPCVARFHIGHVPGDVYESIRLRAPRATQSIQGYLLARAEMGRRRPPGKLLAELEADLGARPPLRVGTDMLLADRDTDRL
jgi:hypothetical protein